ncbi:SGNH/GDSL hydrolase family protein [Arthrobacter sp. FW306-05-C]|uniref:SGNH/GDSL hydrolase family protein n=1 Tax=unclassified Arthrobacter TaxID=235627 RepID=UPI001EEF99C4|nr:MULTISPECIES: SGNH/GDSL hydrolase family protein [unclassified Arthrobacter]UKA65572.1 SGNH/GDSL hydrolase family protein [Arthrobacter sp. FW306-05-C]UKA74238.1 SGNH/GDSL hydrolase family protein [Arthrobacter sp. FW306-07-I]
MSSPSPRKESPRPVRVLTRAAVLALAAGLVLAAPGQQVDVAPGQASPVEGYLPSALLRASAVGQPSATGFASNVDLSTVLNRPALFPGEIYRNPVFKRNEVVVANARSTAVLIGDSQSVPDDSWPRRALAGLGYSVHFCGYGGTGFTAANGKVGNYIDALEHGDWLMPAGAPGLIVIEGGGNDAARGASDAQISANANRLIDALKARYPDTRIVVVGTLARGAQNGGGRRSQVDALLAGIAARQQVTFVSAGDWLTKYNLTQHLADAVHMDAEGRKQLGGVLERRLRELGVPAAPGGGPSLAATGANGTNG